MRIWDIHPGYLNRQSLLGEHRELHGIVSILVNGKKGYANHPETLRWVEYGWALRIRHALLAAEMALRGYTDRTPVTTHGNEGSWPSVFLDEPAQQYGLLERKYADKEQGRIPLPRNEGELWSHHKYSVLARDPNIYREIGRQVAGGQLETGELSRRLVDLLRTPPSQGGVRNAAQHMWGHISDSTVKESSDPSSWSLRTMLLVTQEKAMGVNEPYLMKSTALSELLVWL